MELDKIRRTAFITAAVIYVIILIMNIAGLPKLATDMGNHVFVLACLIFCFIGWKRKRDDRLLVFMILTMAGDILTGFDQTFAVAVVILFVSQIVLTLIIMQRNGGKSGVVLRVVLIAACIIAIAGAGQMSAFYAFGSVYFMWFLANMIQALMAGDRLPLRMRIGIVLYFLGDVCLIGRLLTGAEGVAGIIMLYGTWMVYLPGVYLIATSGGLLKQEASA